MKHLITFLLVGMIGLLSINTTFSQVDDRAVVPVSVTLNSILRLNIESGGNVEFNFNTLDQYQNGITNSPQYDTKISVASSVDWNLKMGAEDPNLIQADSASSSNNMPLDHVGYLIEYTGGGNASDYFINADFSGGAPEPLQQLSTLSYAQIQNQGSNAGGIGQNRFTVHWECGTTNGNMNSTSLLGSNLTGGRYSTNVFFILNPD